MGEDLLEIKESIMRNRLKQGSRGRGVVKQPERSETDYIICEKHCLGNRMIRLDGPMLF